MDQDKADENCLLHPTSTETRLSATRKMQRRSNVELPLVEGCHCFSCTYTMGHSTARIHVATTKQYRRGMTCNTTTLPIGIPNQRSITHCIVTQYSIKSLIDSIRCSWCVFGDQCYVWNWLAINIVYVCIDSYSRLKRDASDEPSFVNITFPPTVLLLFAQHLSFDCVLLV